jgi:hypothetical protein
MLLILMIKIRGDDEVCPVQIEWRKKLLRYGALCWISDFPPC